MTEPITTMTASTSLVFKHGLLALFGAIAHAINAHRMGKTKNFLDFVLLTVLSSFSGVIFALIALHTFDNEYLTLAAAGSGGFLGVEGMSIILNRIKTVIGGGVK